MSWSWLVRTSVGLLAVFSVAVLLTGSALAQSDTGRADDPESPREAVPETESIPEPKSPDSAEPSKKIKEIIIDDSGIILRQGDGEVEVEMEGPGPRFDISVRTREGRVHDGDGEAYFGEDVIVRAHEVVHDDLLVMFGDLTVNGKVVGDILVVRGDVRLFDGAEVTGDITCIGGRVDSEEGARVFGEINPVEMNLPGIIGRGWEFDELDLIHPKRHRTGDAFFDLVAILILAWVGMLILATRIPNLSEGLRRKLGQSVLVGFLTILAAILLLVPLILLFVLLALTIIGIPVVILASVALVGLGYLGWLVPLYTFSRFTFESRGMSRFLSVGLWAVIFWFFHTLGQMFGAFWLFGIIEFVVFLFGIGALVLTRLGARELAME